MSFALLPTTLTMLCAGMAGIFLVLGVLVLGVYLVNKMCKYVSCQRDLRVCGGPFAVCQRTPSWQHI